MNSKMSTLLLCTGLALVGLANSDSGDDSFRKELVKNRCSLPAALVSEIASYKDIANQIIQEATNGSFKGKTYDDLSNFIDTFGSRLSGSPNLEASIDSLESKMNMDGLENVRGEKVTVNRWIRGREWAELVLPRRKNLAILGRGNTIPTPLLGIRAAVLVVRNISELESRAMEAVGKIVVFNTPFPQPLYQPPTSSRVEPTAEIAAATRAGAVLALTRAFTNFSLYTPHTRVVIYDPSLPKIPTGILTVEDCQMLSRMQKRGSHLVIHVIMEDVILPDVTSRNLMGEISGKEKPQEVVIISGHIDSWDVGQGAMDDGGGAFISLEALALLKSLGLKPRRTLRAILWTGEEFGLLGIRSYIQRHKSELNLISAALESDQGTLRPLGLDQIGGTPKAGCIVQEILKLLQPIKATLLRNYPRQIGGTDLAQIVLEGVPAFLLHNENSKYFYYHHTEADTMSVENTTELDLCLALWSVASYVLADISVALPRNNE